MSLLSERIQIVKRDINRLDVDVIVNAANSSWAAAEWMEKFTGRVDRLYWRNAKYSCKTRWLQMGEAVLITAGKLPARFVIHTVGPVWNGGNKNETELPGNCYQNFL